MLSIQGSAVGAKRSVLLRAIEELWLLAACWVIASPPRHFPLKILPRPTQTAISKSQPYHGHVYCCSDPKTFWQGFWVPQRAEPSYAPCDVVKQSYSLHFLHSVFESRNFLALFAITLAVFVLLAVSAVHMLDCIEGLMHSIALIPAGWRQTDQIRVGMCLQVLSGALCTL